MKKNKIGIIVFIIYLALTTWVILFKMAVIPSQIPHIWMRSFNLIPLKESVYINGRLYVWEIIYNVLIFVPFGVFISSLKRNWSAGKKIFAGLIFSLILEVCQFAFALGMCDITDLIANTAGACVGVGLYSLIKKALKDKTDKAVNSVCLAGEICFICLMIVVTVTNLH